MRDEWSALWHWSSLAWGSISRRMAAAGGVSSGRWPLPAAPWKNDGSGSGSCPLACLSPAYCQITCLIRMERPDDDAQAVLLPGLVLV